MSAINIRISLCVFLLSALSTLGNARAQDRPQLNSSMIPSSASVGMIAYPKSIAENPQFRSLPREIFSAMGTSSLGFDPMKIRQATFVVPTPDLNAQEPPEWGLLMQFAQIQGLSDEWIQSAESTRIAGKKAYLMPRQNMGFLVFNETTLILGSPNYLKNMATEVDGDLAKLASKSPLNGDAVGFANMIELRPFFEQLDSRVPRLPGHLDELRQLPELLDSISFSFTMNKRMEFKIHMTARDEDAAREAQEKIAKALETGRELLLTSLAANLELEDPVQLATLKYVERVWDTFEPRFTPDILGRKLSMNLNEEVLALPVLVSLIGFQVEEQVAQIQLDLPENKLRYTGLAIHNFESAYRELPKLTLQDDEGKDLMSGRVALLPFLEQSNLYQAIDKTIPWNEGPNKELSETVIPQLMDSEGRMVCFPVYPGSIWDKNGGLQFSDVRDGTSNTILGIYRKTDRSWADPAPWTISEKNLMRDVFGGEDSVKVVMLDGSTRTLEKRKMTKEKLQALLTYDGSEVIKDD